MDHIDIIKSKLLLSDIVGKKVRLIKRGDSFVGLCPFHNEKTPSFSVSNLRGYITVLVVQLVVMHLNLFHKLKD